MTQGGKLQNYYFFCFILFSTVNKVTFSALTCCFYLFCSERQAEPGGVEHPASPAGHDGEFIPHHCVSMEQSQTGCRNFPRRHISSVPLVPADWFGSNFFCRQQGFNVVSADHFASYLWALHSDQRRLSRWMWDKSFDSQSLMLGRVSGASPSVGTWIVQRPILNSSSN